MLDTIIQDLRFGVRTLRRNPGFAAVAVMTLALGIGANAAMFSVVNAVLLRPLPWSDPDRAVMIWSRWTAFDKTWVAEGEVVQYRRRSRAIAEIAAWSDGQVNLTGDGEPERVPFANVTANLFRTLGASPVLGRTFTDAEDVPNGPNVAVLGHGLWTRRYGSDRNIVARTILVNGRPYEVVGVMPRDFVLPTDFQSADPTELWMPLRMDPASTDHDSHGLYAAGRLAPGATVAQAASELSAIAQALTSEGHYPVQMRFDTIVQSLRDEVVGGVRRSVWLLFAAVGFLLLIACANVANLLLARAEARQREVAVRSALGAGAFRVVRQLLTESLALAGVSAAAGLALAYAALRFLVWWDPAGIPRVSDVGLDLPVLGFTVGLAFVTSILFSLVPALRTLRIDLTDSLKDGGQNASTGGSRQRFRNALVVAEMSLAVALLIGAGLALRSLWELNRVPLGFDPSGVLTMRVAVPAAGYDEPERVVAFYQRLLERVRQLPGVRVAGAARLLPLATQIGDRGVMVEGYTPPPGTNAKGDWQTATDGYLEAIGERLVRGRAFTSADATDSMPVALVNEEMARRYWQGRDAIGGRFRLGREWFTVVGIVGDVRHNGVTEVIKEKFYVPHSQWHKATGSPIRGMTLVIRTDGAPSALVPPVRQVVRELDPTLPVAEVRSMTDVVSAALSGPRFMGVLLALFAALALTLSAIGIYGVLSYVVSRRRREIGIRMAVGAGRAEIVRMVLRSGVLLAFAGVAIGTTFAGWASRFMSGLLHEVSPTDPLTFAVVGATLTVIAVLASLVPAWRETRIDPVTALKTE